MVKDAVLKVYPSEPYDLAVTHRDELNADFSTSLKDEDLVRLSLRRADPARSERGAGRPSQNLR
jgi:hypothetical protein